MQYNDGNKVRLREGEGVSLRVLSSVGDNYNARSREKDRERRAICIYLAEQKKAALRLKQWEGGGGVRKP